MGNKSINILAVRAVVASIVGIVMGNPRVTLSLWRSGSTGMLA
jgi:hypothetical protein